MATILSLMSSEKLSLSTTAAESTADANRARTVNVCADVGHYVLIVDPGSHATTSTGMYMPAGFPYLLSLPAGKVVSAILATGTGNLTVATVKLSN